MGAPDSSPDRAGDRVLPDQYDPDPLLQGLLDRLTTYYPRAIDPDLHRTIRLLHDLGNPHLSLPPVIHVAGTNGKGSIIAYLRAALEAAGLSCHVMTSPHLVRFNERFVVAGQQMATPPLLDLFAEVEARNAGRETTSFELITAAGFLEFSRVRADASLIEVGMGGRYDATNVIPDPVLGIISVISRDHTKFLGTAIEQIAAEKAGIMKAGCPCVIGPQLHEGVMDIFADCADSIGAPLLRYGHEWSFDVLPGRFMLHAGAEVYDFPVPNLVGPHQIPNAATAAMGMLVAGGRFGISSTAIEAGLTHARWPGRLQHLASGPLVELLPEGWELWIDGGHNDSGGAVLGTQADVWAGQDGLPLHLVLGMLTTKDPRDFVAPLYHKAASIRTLTIPDQPLSYKADDLASSLAESFGDGVSAAPSAADAIRAIVAASSTPCRILITGSLYLMGHILTDNE